MPCLRTAAQKAGATTAGSVAGGTAVADSSQPQLFSARGGARHRWAQLGYITAAGLPDGLRAGSTRGLPRRAEPAEEDASGCKDEAALRIFLRDAERTFQDETHRQRMIGLLKRVWPENRDYHQGLGYVCSLLMLFFDDETTVRSRRSAMPSPSASAKRAPCTSAVALTPALALVQVRMLLRMTRDDKYTPGYWKAAPAAYVRDAMVSRTWSTNARRSS